MEIKVLEKNYEVIKDVNEGFNLEELEKKFGDYFLDYDYVVGDWAYGKLRLKGFNKKGHKNFKPINDYGKLDKYIKENCAYECKYFIIEKK